MRRPAGRVNANPGGEPNTVAQRRGVAAVEALARRDAGRQIAVGTHGTLLALILQHYDPTIDAAFVQRLTLPDLYQLTLAGDGSARIDRLWDAGDARDWLSDASSARSWPLSCGGCWLCVLPCA